MKPGLNGMEFVSIAGSDRVMLEWQFSKKEVWNVVSRMKGNKAPGPDGISISFFQKCWDIIKLDLLEVMEEFYYLEEFYNHLNDTFIMLMPKCFDAKDLKDYRPISLLSSVYKIISKVLASRLKLVMKGIIVQPQCAFVEGRQILDSVLIANECIENRRLSSRNSLLCKLDMQKSYDHVNWDFLDYILSRMGFWVK